MKIISKLHELWEWSRLSGISGQLIGHPRSVDTPSWNSVEPHPIKTANQIRSQHVWHVNSRGKNSKPVVVVVYNESKEGDGSQET